MKTPKKVITRLLLNNWGGISHQVMELHEYVNLFSGMSGSGKSTVMDAIQVLLYGSLSQNFLNKAADERNRRTVMTYLKGAQKDGTANREGQDFCSNLVMEIQDLADDAYRCVGVCFEVRREERDLSRYSFFSHEGKMDGSFYRDEEGNPLRLKQMSALVKSHQKDPSGKLKGEDLNRMYPTNDAYQNALYGPIFGDIDGRRFTVMEKSAVALKMSNGVGQFIRDYMFPKSTSQAIEKISRQLGDYRDIRDTVADLEKRIGLLEEVRRLDGELAGARADVVRGEYRLKQLKILGIRGEMECLEAEGQELLLQENEVRSRREALKGELNESQEAVVELRSRLKSSDYGKIREQLESLKETEGLLEKNQGAWNHVLAGLSCWEENEEVYGLVGNQALQALEDVRGRKVTAQVLEELKKGLEETLDEVNNQRDNLVQERRERSGALKEKEERLSDWNQGQKSYRHRKGLKEAQRALEQALFRETGRQVPVTILADAFDIRDSQWREAIEGRLGRVKYGLITPPEYASLAVRLFGTMEEFENVDLFHVKRILEDEPQAVPGSLYEEAEAGEGYVDGCLKHFLGRIMKCRNVEELETVKDGVTRDCYSYSNYTLRHLPSRDCVQNACIGRNISKGKIRQLEEEIRRQKEEMSALEGRIRALDEARSYERISREVSEYLNLFEAGRELEGNRRRQRGLEEELERLEQAGALNALKEELARAQKAYEEKEEAYGTAGARLSQIQAKMAVNSAALEGQRRQLQEETHGFRPNQAEDQALEERLKEKSLAAVRAAESSKLEQARAREQKALEGRLGARLKFNRAYPSCGLTGAEETGASYEELYKRYRRQYVEDYKEQFDRKCREVYASLRDNVIASIHGDIKAAYRQVREVNQVLGATSFYDSVYKIGITPAANENRQFYDMLMAPELDSKVVREEDMEGQISLGDDEFQRKYQQEIDLLVEKFIPSRTEDEMEAARRRAQMEQYADYRNYLTFNMYEVTVDEEGREKRIAVDEMAGNDSGGEGQNPKYAALFAGFALLYAQQYHRESRIRLVLLDEAFSKMDKTRSSVCLDYARKLGLQVIICVPDERLMTLMKNVDCVYGFRRRRNRISMMMIDKGRYLEMLRGEEDGDKMEEKDRDESGEKDGERDRKEG